MLYLSNTAALKSLSTHGCPFRRLWRCVSWSDLHRNTTGRSRFSLAGSALLSGGFDLSEPPLKRFPPEEYSTADSHGWEVWDASNFAIDNVAEMGSRTSDELGCLGQIQDWGDSCVLELEGKFGLIKALRKRCYRMRGGGRHTVLRCPCSSGRAPQRELMEQQHAVPKLHNHLYGMCGLCTKSLSEPDQVWGGKS